ncbi:MAG: tetratricopeptide repeat protein [Pirellulaceae bacterium]
MSCLLEMDEIKSFPESNDEWIIGRSFALIGRFAECSRNDVIELIEARGGNVVEPNNESIDYLVVGERERDKMATLRASIHATIHVDSNPELLTETDFWQRLGDDHHDEETLYTLSMLASLLELPISIVRRWQRRGLIVATRQINRLAYFGFDQLVSARSLAKMIVSDGKASLAVEAKLARLAQLGAVSEMNVVVDGRTVLVRNGDALNDVSGQGHLDFYRLDDEGAFESEHVALLNFPEQLFEPEPEQPNTIDQFLRRALAFEDDNDVESALDVYREMMRVFGPTADTCFAVGELYYSQGEIAAARERYLMAVELDGSFVEALANLGCLLMETGELSRARAAFEDAIEVHANYADAHFHLAKTLDSIGDPTRAEEHWRRFLELAPRTPWANEARERLRQSSVEVPQLLIHHDDV